MTTYTPKPLIIEAILLEEVVDALRFLKNGEFTVIQRDGVYVLTSLGTVFAPMGECYLIRWASGIDIMDKDEFEHMYEETK